MLQQRTSGLRNWGIGLIFITCLIISCIPVKKDVVNSDKQRIAELKARIGEGGVHEAAIRSLVYIGLAGEGVDERAFNELRNIRD